MSGIIVPEDKGGVIFTNPKLYYKIQEYVRTCDFEIHGYGHVSSDEDGDLIIRELFPIPKQTVSAAEVETQESAMYEMIKSPYSRRLNLQWHSHVNMGTFWSAQDEQCISQLGITLPMLVSIVANKRGEYKCRLDIFKPMRVTIPLTIKFQYQGLAFSEVEKIRAEVKEKTVKKQYKKPSDDDVEEYSFPFDKRNGGSESTVRNAVAAYLGSKADIMFTDDGAVYEEINPAMTAQGWCKVDGSLTKVQDINWIVQKFTSIRRRLIENGGESNQQSLFGKR